MLLQQPARLLHQLPVTPTSTRSFLCCCCCNLHGCCSSNLWPQGAALCADAAATTYAVAAAASFVSDLDPDPQLPSRLLQPCAHAPARGCCGNNLRPRPVVLAAAAACDHDLRHSDSRLPAVLLLLLAKMALSPLCWVCAKAVSGAKIIWDTSYDRHFSKKCLS